MREKEIKMKKLIKFVPFCILICCGFYMIFYSFQKKEAAEMVMDVGPFSFEYRMIEKSAQCPPDKPFRNTLFGDCYNCDELEPLWILAKDKKTLNAIENCQNRMLIDEDGHPNIKKSILKNCPSDTSLRTSEGSCVSCNTLKSISVNQESDCDICSNRTYQNGGCYITTCPPSSPVRGWAERCHSCTEENVFDASKEECDKCPNRRRIEGTWMDGKCALITTDNSEYPLVHFPPQHNDPGEIELISRLEPCSTLEPVPTVKESCDKCSNRKYIDGKCILIN